MNYIKKQSELDVKKWIDSETKQYDTCGEYNYCAHCNKNEAYPCACAYEKYTALNKAIKSATKATNSTKIKTTTKKSTCTSKRTTTSKKPTTSKTTKTTNKKTVKA